MRSHPFLLSMLALPLLLSGCGGAREALGLGRAQPDEFAVVDRPPLALPPDFSLKPPTPGVSRPQEIDMNRRAEQVVFNTSDAPKTTDSKPVGLEQMLLQKAGAETVEPGIRATLDREAGDLVVSNNRFIDHLLWWKGENLPPAAVVDAPEERKRIEANKAEGKPADDGATPIIERKKSGLLGL
jgi:hypothetical protein